MEPERSRVLEFKRNVRAEYGRYSVVKKIMNWRQSIDDEGLRFVQIGSRFHVPVEVLVTPRVGDPDVAANIIGIGQSIAIGEERYLVRQLQEFIARRDRVEHLSFDSVIGSLSRGNLRELKSVLIPLTFYSAIHLGKFDKLHVDYEDYNPFLVLGPIKIPIYWSSNSVPFDELIFIEDTLGKWVIKPDPIDGESLTIEVQGVRSQKVDVVVKTVSSFSRDNSKAGLILSAPPLESPKDLGAQRR